MNRALLLAVVVAVSAMAGLGCAGAAPNVAALSPEGARVDVAMQDGADRLPERDGMAQLDAEKSGHVFATENPDDRDGEGFRTIDSACGIVPEDRDRR